MTGQHASSALGLAHFSAIDVAPAEFIALASKAGFRRVGLRLYPAFPGAPFYELAVGSGALREVRRRIEGEGVAIHDIEFVIISADFSPPDLTRMLETASVLGAHRLSVCGDDPDRSRLVANFAALCELAEGFDMGVDLENMGWRSVAKFSDSVSILREAGHPAAGALVDALHFFRNGATVEALLLPLPPAVRSVQLCDVAGPAPLAPEDMVREARSGRLAPGRGELPLVELMRAVPDDAAISVEVPLTGGIDPETHIAGLFHAAMQVLERAAEPHRSD
jgi:sugar phosphate isomerase/epimerase